MPDENSIIDISIEEPKWEEAINDTEDFVRNIIQTTLSEFEDASGAIDVLLCGSDRIQELNKQWRGKNTPTNVLSFEHLGGQMLGDIAIDIYTCEKEAIEQNKSLKNHITHLIIHGTLHLLGYDHINDEEAQEMESLEIEILEKMGINNPYEIADIAENQ